MRLSHGLLRPFHRADRSPRSCCRSACCWPGIVAYRFLPISALPSVDIPTIVVIAARPGADPETMANSVAAPLERRLGEISGVTEITSTSSIGNSSVVVQFDIDRDINGAAHDVQAAINAAITDLPSDCPRALLSQVQSRPMRRS